VAECVEDALLLAKEIHPELVVSEQRFGAKNWLDLLTPLKAAGINARFAIVTASGSITNAVMATRLGVAAYLAKPVSPRNIIDAVMLASEDLSHCANQPTYCSLERAKWEYINMMVTTAGSIAEAARRLRVERRSLRRMLAKYPPAE